MSYGHEGGMAANAGAAIGEAAATPRPEYRNPTPPGISKGLLAQDRTANKNSILQNLTTRLEQQSLGLGELIHQLTRITDRLCGGSEDVPTRVNPPPAYSAVGSLQQLAELTDDRLKAFAYQLSRLEDTV